MPGTIGDPNVRVNTVELYDELKGLMLPELDKRYGNFVSVQNLVNHAGPIQLGEVQGDLITAVKIYIFGRWAYTGAPSNMYIKPNGLSTITASRMAHFFYYQSGVGMAHSVDFGADQTTHPGFHIAVGSHWSASGASNVCCEATLFTSREGIQTRHARSTYTAQDDTVNSNHYLRGDMWALWNEGSTPITSLSLVMTGTTPSISGRVAMEIIP